MARSAINALRWRVFKVISCIGWRVCPQEDRIIMQSVMPRWKDITTRTQEPRDERD